MLLCVFLAACVTGSSDVAGSTDGTGGGGTTGADPLVQGAAVTDLTLTQITLYQGVAIDLMLDGAAVDLPQASIVAGRQALVRAFFDATDFQARPVQALLEVTSGANVSVYEHVLEPVGVSIPGQLESTFHFDVAGADVDPGTSFRLSLHEMTGQLGDIGEGIVWDTALDGAAEVEVGGLMDVVLIPVEYNFDGSGRLPDTSTEQLTMYEDLLTGMYAAEKVTVSVGDVLPWDKRIDGSGDGWSDVLNEVADFRASADVPESTYFYAVFEPEPTLSEFCGGSCVLGLSNVAFSANDTWARSSIGIGYGGVSSTETMVHEVGHAHGRDHAPCGLYGQGSDPGWPYDDAGLGVWGYDIVTGALYSPTKTVDMMSYCSPIWVSDYTYQALFKRIQELGENPKQVGPPLALQRATVDAEGTVTLRSTFTQRGESGGRPVQVAAEDVTGAVHLIEARLLPYSHLEGGTLVLPTQPQAWRRITLLTE